MAILTRKALMAEPNGADLEYEDVPFGDDVLRIQPLSVAAVQSITIRNRLAADLTIDDRAAAESHMTCSLIAASVVDEDLKPIFRNGQEVERWISSLRNVRAYNSLVKRILEYNRLGEDAVGDAVENFTETTNGSSSTA